MKKSIVFAAVLAALLSLAASTVAPSQAAQTRKTVTAQEKAASDTQMNNGLTNLQAAQSSFSSGNYAAALASLQTAAADMKAAMPIYHGYRVKSIRSADIAIRQLGHPKKAASAGTAIGSAITDAQTALTNSKGSLEVNE